MLFSIASFLFSPKYCELVYICAETDSAAWGGETVQSLDRIQNSLGFILF